MIVAGGVNEMTKNLFFRPFVWRRLARDVFLGHCMELGRHVIDALAQGSGECFHRVILRCGLNNVSDSLLRTSRTAFLKRPAALANQLEPLDLWASHSKNYQWTAVEIRANGVA